MLLTLEGIDGSGKSTCLESLKDVAFLDDVTFTQEPTATWYGDTVRRSIDDDDADPLAELFLYTADHAAHLAETVQPALERGDVVISDRYSDSRYAYQGAMLQDRFDDALTYVKHIHQPWTRPPDATIYLDIDPETGARRSGATDKFESAASLAAVRDNYERLLADEPERFVRIDATQDLEAVRTEVVDAVETLVGESG